MTDDVGDVGAFQERLEAAGLGKFTDSLVAMARSSVRLVADSAAPDIERYSRLGGLPDLPVSTTWPRNDDVPLSFIAQVNLAEVAPYEPDGLLPRDGLLSFFYDAVSQGAWGFDPADHGSAAVVYTPDSAVTERRDPPADLSGGGVFGALGLRPRAELTFAPWESYDVERLGMTRDEGFAYAELFEGQGDVIHRLIGHPDPVQGDMQVECQLVTNGLYCGDSTGYDDARAAGLQDGAAEWRLLLQVDSEDAIDMMWGDVGRLYYWIRRSDLLARDWERSWLILQCC
ncbi:YwqG family protein [Kribbella sp. NPDC054772]